jgi:hypothetical protein
MDEESSQLHGWILPPACERALADVRDPSMPALEDAEPAAAAPPGYKIHGSGAMETARAMETAQAWYEKEVEAILDPECERALADVRDPSMPALEDAEPADVYDPSMPALVDAEFQWRGEGHNHTPILTDLDQ